MKGWLAETRALNSRYRVAERHALGDPVAADTLNDYKGCSEVPRRITARCRQRTSAIHFAKWHAAKGADGSAPIQRWS
jgi:hypothetical protein